MDENRYQKAQKLREQGVVPYAASFDRSHILAEAANLDEGDSVRVCGRVVLFRDMGKLSFATLQDHSGRMQIAFKKDVLGDAAYEELQKIIDLGDFIGVEGSMFTTKKGEPTVEVQSWTMLTKALRSPPEKWHGIADQETAWRQRYLDMSSNRETFDRFLFRSEFVKKLREFYWNHSFIEVEVPVLVNAASGALATPFTTHHEAYDMDVFLRIAPETYLKECLVGGMDRVFEVARCFRNEGLDPSHLQEFTMCEHYATYWDYADNMRFTEEMMTYLLRHLNGSMVVQIPDREGNLVEVDFTPPWPRITIQEAIEKACGIDIQAAETADDLRAAMKKQKIILDVNVEVLGLGNLIDQLYKKVSRPSIVQPTFLINHPVELSPLARVNDENPRITDRFQLVVGGWEVVNAYSELIDPFDQAQRFEQQAQASQAGDSDAHDKDDAYVKALEYGCPPCSGWGMGIDRMVALLTQQSNLRDVVLFPLMKPIEKSDIRHPLSEVNEEEKLETSNVKPKTISDPSTPSTMSDDPLMLQHADYSHLLPAAHGLIEEHTDQTKAHLIATGAAMEALAHKFGGDPQTWKVAGMLHDLDWDQLDKDYEAHCGDTLEHLLSTIEAPEELLSDIRAHYQAKYGGDYPLNTLLRKCLYCVDELTGFIIAVTLVRPSKKIADVQPKSVKKKLKDKSFAAQVDRAQIKACEELIGLSLDELVEITLSAMQGVADELGL